MYKFFIMSNLAKELFQRSVSEMQVQYKLCGYSKHSLHVTKGIEWFPHTGSWQLLHSFDVQLDL